MCFLNKLLLLAVLGWLFQVGRWMAASADYRALESKEGLGQKKEVLREMDIAMTSEDNLLDPGPQ